LLWKDDNFFTVEKKRKFFLNKKFFLNLKCQQDVMKKLNKHPRLFKKTALSLKKLIMRGIKQMRTLKLNEKSHKINVKYFLS